MKWNLPVDEFTTPNPVTATEEQSIDELRQMMHDCGVRHLPVVRDGKVVGVVSDRDVRVAQGLGTEHRFQVRAADIMATDPVMVPASMPLDRVAFTMSDRKIGSVIVNEDDGEFLGIFTVTDALNALIEISRAGREHD
ncbi:MAG: CBS domain-containing protein [Pseudomonadales bacterium]|jgi:acetoin utilization protein AcuB|nr:CBS domain-containing protein [Pseudomonadales bacterium]MCP5321856.1 CBS domain-containing protein [Pseudomonadales bacterium]